MNPTLTMDLGRTDEVDTGSISALDERSRLIRHRAGDLTLHLVKALLQTNYYSADHPLARATTDELFERYRALMNDVYEITYTLQSLVDERGVLIEGVLPEPIEVATTLRGILGDYFVTKFHDYFAKNRIASITLKRGITRIEFETFLAVWVGGAIKGIQDGSVAGKLSDELTRHGIVHVTFVGMDELVGAGRRLSWPVRSALSRLRKDLLRIPILRSARNETAETLRAMVIGDAIRPIASAEVIRDVLVNLDLVSEGLAEISEDDISTMVVSAIPQKMLLHTAQSLMDLMHSQESHFGRIPETHINPFARQVARSAVTKVLTRLASLDIAEARIVLSVAFKRGLIALKALPEEIQRSVKAEEITDSFLASADAYLREFEQCGNPKTYLKYLNVFTAIVPSLIKRKDIELLNRIFSILDVHLHEAAPPFVGRARFITETLKSMERAGVIDGLLSIVASTPKDKRGGIERGVVLFGSSAVPGLVTLLSSSEDISNRKAVARMLLEIGKEAVPFLVEELRAHRHPVNTVRYLIQILGEMRTSKALDIILVYGKHPNEKIRLECVNAIAAIEDERSQRHLIGFLKDRDESVVRMAVHHLGALHCVLPEFISWLGDTIRLRTRREEEPAELLQAACLRALAHYENTKLDDWVEDCLIEIVSPPRLKRLLPGNLGVRPKPRDLVLLAVRALGAIGTGKALGVLSDLLNTDDTEMKEAVSEAVECIRSRQTSSVTRRPPVL